MHNKSIIYGTCAVLLLVVFAAGLFFNLFDEKKETVSSDSSCAEQLDIYSSVPADAVFVLKIVSDRISNDITSSFSTGASSASDAFVRRIYAEIPSLAGCTCVMSAHYSGKNRLSLLYSLRSENIGTKDGLRGHGTLVRDGIYESPHGVYFKVKDDRLLFCDNRIVLESSLRSLETGTSILDVEEFNRLAREKGSFDNVMIINHQQIGKVFSGWGSASSLKYSDFVSSMTSWSAFVLNAGEHYLSASGTFENGRGKGNFSEIFRNMPSTVPDVFSVLPANVSSVVRIPVGDISEYMDKYKAYVEISANITDYNWMQTMLVRDEAPSPQKWIEQTAPSEVVLVSVPVKDTMEWGVLMKLRSEIDFGRIFSKKMSRDNNVEIHPFPYRGYIGSLFGNLFRLADESCFIRYRDWMIVGSENFLKGYTDGTYGRFSFHDMALQTPAFRDLVRPASLVCLLNLQEMKYIIPGFFNDKSVSSVDSLLASANFQYLEFSLDSREGIIMSDLFLYSEKMERLPEPDSGKDASGFFSTADTVVNVPSGPYPVENFLTGKTNYLKQLQNHKLQLLDERNKSVWTLDFDTEIAGYVEQVDKYKNGKLQMLFCAGNKVYLVDRLGRYVSGYPEELDRDVLLGPKVYDLKGTKDYTFIVLHTDNSIGFYDLSGKRYAGWSDIRPKEKITGLPELFKVGKDYYWKLETSETLRIFTLEGKECTLSDSKRKIDRKSEVHQISEDAVSIKCTDGKEYVLNLKNGNLKRR